MKFTVKKPVEFEVTHVQIIVPVLYGEEDIPDDFPGRVRDVWEALIEIETGRIVGWCGLMACELYMKVCDSGRYYLLGQSGDTIAKLENEYVPHGVVPGEYGDYIELKISADGIISNWPKKPDVKSFFREEDTE